jgi:hypothetical protein
VNQTVFNIQPGGAALARTLGFRCRSVIVDNYTSSYVNITDAGKTIAPWVYGAVVTLPPGITQANASLTPTVPAVAGPPVPVIQTTLTWTDQELPVDPGHPLQQSQFSVSTLLDRIDTAPGGTTKTYSVPAGAVSIGMSTDFDATGTSTQNRFNAPTFAEIAGQPSGAVYVDLTSSLVSPSVTWVLLDPNDRVVTVQYTIVANPLNCFIDVFTSPLALAGQQEDLQGNLLVSLANAFPAPWQAADHTVEVADALANGGTVTKIAGVPGFRIFVHTITLGFDAASAGNDLQILEGGATGTSRGRISAATVAPPAQDWKGRTFAAGNGLTLKANGAALTPRGTIAYTVAL